MSIAGFSEEDRLGLNTQRARELGFDCGSGSYCSGQIRTPTVPGSNGGIFHRTKTTITDGKATTEVYIISDGRWVNVAKTTDGGKTYTFSEATRPNGTKVAGDGLRQSLSSGGDMNKNVNKQVNDTLKSGGADLIKEPKLTNTQIKETGAVNNNIATNPEESSNGDNKPPISDEDKEAFNQENVFKENTRLNYGDVKYPRNLSTTHQDCIKFTIL